MGIGGQHLRGGIPIKQDDIGKAGILVYNPTEGYFEIVDPSTLVVADAIKAPCGEAIPENRVVCIDIADGLVYLADKDIDNRINVIGYTKEAFALGEECSIYYADEVEDPNFTLPFGTVYLGNNGEPFIPTTPDAPPTTGWVIVIGFSRNGTSYIFSRNQPIFKN